MHHVHARSTTAHERHQIRVYTGYLRIRNTLWQGREPPLRLPLHCILSPDGLVGIRREDANTDRGVLGDHEFMNHLSVHALDGLRKRYDCILDRPVSNRRYVRARWEARTRHHVAHSRNTCVAGEYLCHSSARVKRDSDL